MTDVLDRARQAQRQLAQLGDLTHASPMSPVLAADLLDDLADEIERLRARLATVEALLEDADPDWEDRPR